MKLIKSTRKIRCEMGACRRLADYTIAMDRVGIRSNIHVCGDCLKELYGLIGEQIIPKSLETAVRQSRRSESALKEWK